MHRRLQRTSGPVAAPSRLVSADWLWGLGAVVTVVAAGLTPILFNRGYYFRGDTQMAYFGAFFHLGESLRDGRIPLLDPSAWHGGAFAVEGFWGLFNPLVWLMAVGASTASNALVYMTFVKFVVLAISASGTFLLARSYGVLRPIAYVVGVLVPLAGFTMYLDAPTWFLGATVSGLLPWAWWGMRRAVLLDRHPLPALLACYLLVTVGYVYGTAMLAVTIAATMLDAGLRGRPREVLKGLLIGVCAGLAGAAVHLPFILSSEVTTRSSWQIRSGGMGTPDLTSLLTGTIPTTGQTPPLFYIAWLVPMLVFVDWRRARAGARDLVGLGLACALAWAWLLAPSTMGPLRYTMRLMPYVVLTSLVLAAVALSRGRTAWSTRRWILALGIAAVSGYIGMTRDVDLWRIQLAMTVLVCVGLTITWLLLRGFSRLGQRPGSAALVAGVWTVLLIGAQHHYAPLTFAVDRGIPERVADYKSLPPGAVGDTFLVGHPLDAVPANSPRRVLPMGNAWHVTGHDLVNVSTATGFRAFDRRFCMSFKGSTCVRSLDTILGIEPSTGSTRADLMSVSSLFLLKKDVPRRLRREPPPGWQVASDTRRSVTWVRDKPLPAAGGVTWEQEGVRVREVSRDAESVRLAIEAVPAAGGRVVLSRLAFPGYTVSAGSVVDPVDGYLLTVDLPKSAEGTTVTVAYAPPHWGLLRGGLLVGIALAVVWSVLAAVPRLRRRRSARPERRPLDTELGADLAQQGQPDPDDRVRVTFNSGHEGTT